MIRRYYPESEEIQSLIGPYRLSFLLEQLDTTRGLLGDVIEVGVFNGGSLLEIHKHLERDQRNIVGFDTFEGLPPPTAEDNHHKQGEFRSDFDVVSKAFLGKRVELVKGIYPDSALERPISFCHLDVDFYKGTIDSLVFVDRHLEPGGVIVIDDYKSPDCLGVERAVKEFLSRPDLSYEVIDSPHHQVALKKLK